MFVIFDRLYPQSRFPYSVRSSLPAPNVDAPDE
jgi:hypothetical protein